MIVWDEILLSILTARHVVEKQGNIDSAMQVLKDCELLKIEDILPFFPDFVKIDKFKVFLDVKNCIIFY